LSIERDGETITFDTPGKVTGYPVYRDDVVVMRSSGGGGYGDPLERDADLVRRDVAFGVVSAERAAEGYCVVLDAAGAVDTAATDAARAMSRGRRHGLRVVADDTIEAYAGAKGKRRIVPLSAEDAAALGARDGDLIELLGANPAPLRGGRGLLRGRRANCGWTRSLGVCCGARTGTQFGFGGWRCRRCRRAWRGRQAPTMIASNPIQSSLVLLR